LARRSAVSTAFLEIEAIRVAIGSQVILQDVSFGVERGAFHAIIGPNGSGKTTLIRAIAGAVPIAAGNVTLDGEPLAKLGTRALARRVAVLRQEVSLEFEFTVEEVVRMGRSPYRQLLDADTDEDRIIVEESLAMTDTAHLKERIFPSLSGGEKQRVLLA